MSGSPARWGDVSRDDTRKEDSYRSGGRDRDGGDRRTDSYGDRDGGRGDYRRDDRRDDRGNDDRRGGHDDRRGGYDDRRDSYRRDDRGYGGDRYNDRRDSYRRDDRGYDDRRGGYDDRRDDRRGGYDDRRGGYDDRRGGYDDRRGGYGGDRYNDRRGGGGYGGGRFNDRRGGGPRRQGTYGTEEDRKSSTTLFVGNLSFTYEDRDLEDLFREYGDVSRASVGKVRATGRSKGFGFVTFADRASAEKAFEACQGKDVEGRRLRLDWDIGIEKKREIYGKPVAGPAGEGPDGGRAPRRTPTPPPAAGSNRSSPRRSPSRSPAPGDKRSRSASRSPSRSASPEAKRAKRDDE